ncbi:hypothetical protein HK103_000113 [Boothiomyces macroporosus]|uniref:F-box domain-containing protein n=1 Tax=Boothiomyces macroporosus TaxID=261099 RepID=A0AAD5YBG2_9FUNG|nr:hypothetical protein HK103_000113 [Boothiomyces macroporosus]
MVLKKRKYEEQLAIHPHPKPFLFNDRCWKVVFSWLSPVELVICEQVCKRWKLMLEKLDERLWKPLVQKDFKIIVNRLPDSFRSWKVMYGCRKNLKTGVHDFISLNTNGVLEAGTWADIRPRTLEHVRFKTGGYRQAVDFPAHRRYICALPVIKDHSDKVILYNNYIFYPSDTLIYGRHLLNGRKIALTGHSAPVVQMKDNGNGVLISLDKINSLLVWDISALMDSVPIAACTSILGFNGDVLSFDLFKDHISVLFTNGTIAVWEIISGALISLFSLIQPYVELLKIPSRIVLGEEFLAIGVNSGDTLLFERHKANSTSMLKYNYILTKSFKENEVSDHGQTHSPYTMILESNFIITNGAFPDELTFWRIKPSQPANSCGNLYTSASLMAAREFEMPSLVKHVKRGYSISELKSMERYSIAIPQLGDIQVSKMDIDHTMIASYSAPTDNSRRRLLVWDFRVDRQRNRYFEYVLLGNIGMWLVFDDVQ